MGDLLQTVQGNWRRVTAIIPILGQETVYNFTVDQNHDYFVGETGFLVHNEECLCKQLRQESAGSPWTEDGLGLTDDAINGAREIIPPGQIGNSGIPGGFGKWATGTFQSPAGDFQAHFYRNAQTGENYFGRDFKAVMNCGFQFYK